MKVVIMVLELILVNAGNYPLQNWREQLRFIYSNLDYSSCGPKLKCGISRLYSTWMIRAKQESLMADSAA